MFHVILLVAGKLAAFWACRDRKHAGEIALKAVTLQTDEHCKRFRGVILASDRNEIIASARNRLTVADNAGIFRNDWNAPTEPGTPITYSGPAPYSVHISQPEFVPSSALPMTIALPDRDKYLDNELMQAQLSTCAATLARHGSDGRELNLRINAKEIGNVLLTVASLLTQHGNPDDETPANACPYCYAVSYPDPTAPNGMRHEAGTTGCAFCGA